MADTKLINANIDENAGIAWLILNRPEKKNALSIALLAELSSILRALAENDKIRCIVTTGGGDSYSSGRDLYDMRGQDNRRRTRGFGGVAEIVDIMRKLPQVTVAKVRGWCLGGGLALINGHDLVISAESAKFGMPEVIRGSYGATATPSLFHAGIPFKKAFYISLTGRNLTGIEAERVGLVSDVVPDKDLDSYVDTLAQRTRQPQRRDLRERQDRRLHAKRLALRHGAARRRPRPTSLALLHQPAERRGRIPPLAKGRRIGEVYQAGRSEITFSAGYRQPERRPSA